MAKKQAFSMEDYLRNNLQSTLREEFGRKTIERTEMPEYFGTSLNPFMPLRPYQKEAFQYFINFWENDYEGKPLKPHLLFHMATGSGKTLIMAGLILYLYKNGYRNFLFFVGSSNVVGKTEDNFFNAASAKYQFAQSINIDGKQVEIHRVDNFQAVDDDCINLCLTTTQGLHSDLNTPKEGGVSYNDFSTKGLVLISDEAHHMNGAAKKGVDVATQIAMFDDEDFEPSDDWETTVMRIFQRPPEDCKTNILLEFTATEDFTDQNIADKYADKIIFDYPLKKFREDGYSKDIAVVQSDASPLERAIQAIILSQYRRKLFTTIKQDVKPVVMFKSKTIAANKAFHDEFVQAVKTLTDETLQRIRSHAHDDILSAFTYFEEKGITNENLLLELQEDFKEDNLLLVDGNNISPEKQSFLNSLEEKDNEFRAVFAVDMLNEGWDVLNLFDIVRLYDTRDSKGNAPGKTTNAEAQLIGRGARYMPFVAPKSIAQDGPAEYKTNQEDTETPTSTKQDNVDLSAPVGSRKYDNDLTNRLRALETLHYHSSQNPRYVQELNTALTNSGIIAPRSREVSEKLKDRFKKTRLYTDGYVFANEPEPYLLNKEITSIGQNILDREFQVRIKSGDMEQSSAMSTATVQDTMILQQRSMKLGDFSKHIIRAAINRLPEFTYRSLSDFFPNLKSVKEFIESDAYLSLIRVKLLGQKDVIENLSQKEQLNVVLQVLRDMTPMLAKGGIGTRGTKFFKGHMVRDVFKDHTFRVPDGSDKKEEGISIKATTNLLLRFDVDKADWFAYDDNYGTDEEKYLIKYIESIMYKLEEKYNEIYLVRNEKDLKIYDFETGRATEPDFVLFMRRKYTEGVFDNIQIFIEPKGPQLRGTDSWKAEFQKRIHSEGFIQFHTENQDFEIWGMPFYTESVKKEFEDAMKANFEI
ncbi:MAG: DEAD/DEAH box helicase family protein [Muribaculaceae bacterium]|nr:DEAD/DEAH box helicase family protein [Muribaculaceae bacterium]